MYYKDIYKEKDKEKILSLLRDYPLGILINQNNELLVSHLPFHFSEENDQLVLFGHVSKKNPQLAFLKDNEEVLVVFSGPSCYISSSWYDYAEVPTWNYMAVHVKGSISFQSEKDLFENLKHLTNQFEKGEKNPLNLEGLPEHVLKQQKRIQGFSITASIVNATFKLSQGMDEKNFSTIINELEKKQDSNAKLVAEEMKKLK